MSYRFMRMVSFFDLPTTTKEDLKRYRDFRKFLIKNGFLMMQESVYCKLSTNGSQTQRIIDRVRKNTPAQGLVQILMVTEKQFTKIETLVGATDSSTIDSTERLVIL